MNRKTEIIEEVTTSISTFVFALIEELTIPIRDVVLDGQRIYWTDYVSSTPEYLKWTAAAIQTATGVRHPDVSEAVAQDLQDTFKDLTGHLDIHGFTVDYEPAMGTWRVHFRERGLESALLNELNLYVPKPISVYFDIQDESPGIDIPPIRLLDSADVERYREIFYRIWTPTLHWLQFRSSNDNLTG